MAPSKLSTEPWTLMYMRRRLVSMLIISLSSWLMLNTTRLGSRELSSEWVIKGQGLIRAATASPCIKRKFPSAAGVGWHRVEEKVTPNHCHSFQIILSSLLLAPQLHIRGFSQTNWSTSHYECLILLLVTLVVLATKRAYWIQRWKQRTFQEVLPGLPRILWDFIRIISG